MSDTHTWIRPMTTAQVLNMKIPTGTPGKEAIKENYKENVNRLNKFFKM